MVVSSTGIGTAQGCANAAAVCRCVAYASIYATQRHGSRSNHGTMRPMRRVDDSGGLCMSWHTRWNESPTRTANPVTSGDLRMATHTRRNTSPRITAISRTIRWFPHATTYAIRQTTSSAGGAGRYGANRVCPGMRSERFHHAKATDRHVLRCGVRRLPPGC